LTRYQFKAPFSWTPVWPFNETVSLISSKFASNPETVAVLAPVPAEVSAVELLEIYMVEADAG
jgi:hypothetical protein